MVLLEYANALLKVFDQLMNWAVNCKENQVYFDKNTKIIREKVVKDLEKIIMLTAWFQKKLCLHLTQ